MLCRDGGTYIVVGQYTDNGEVALNPHHMINRKHLTVKGCWGSDFSHFYRGVQFMTKHASIFPWQLVVSQVFALQARLPEHKKNMLVLASLHIFNTSLGLTLHVLGNYLSYLQVFIIRILIYVESTKKNICMWKISNTTNHDFRMLPSLWLLWRDWTFSRPCSSLHNPMYNIPALPSFVL